MEKTHKNKKNKNAERPIKALRVKWTESTIKALLSFLLKNKEKLKELKYKYEAVSNPENIQLWKDAENFLLGFDFEQSYTNIQIANKWKNLVDNYKMQLAASKKSGGSPIVIQYKDEIKAILNKDRPILNLKLCIDSTAKNSIQRLLEQQEARQIESEKRREEQRAKLFQMKQQNDFMLFNLLNNLTNCLSSLYREPSEDNLPQFFTPSTPLPQFNNRETSMVYQNNIDDTSNDVEE
ncbi:hypothetical protein RclHR1_07270008 [Rhizophagus clarus]|uniref:Uncharacterized protein n=1 Tax=Rhizophagus clarus TaxID=94130 RepID=A0A2Z6S248_9GLOM|nr:hypothetical protein RclHR1_07270008 [Rhizophagus clarus]GES78779.1 hypothetical protein GLOIN_2v1817865 [Rhizophagus clarus]